jgi:GTP-dependent phosphoenolpyruvate carboxykinase
MGYNNKNPENKRIARKNFTRGNDHFRPSSINYSKDDQQEAMYRTILGTINLIEKNNTGKLELTDEDIEKGIKINAEHLGISEEEYKEKMKMLTDPQPEPNSEASTETTGPLL